MRGRGKETRNKIKETRGRRVGKLDDWDEVTRGQSGEVGKLRKRRTLNAERRTQNAQTPNAERFEQNIKKHIPMKKQIIPLLVIMGIMLYYGCKKTPEIPTSSNKIVMGETTADTVSYYSAMVSTKIETTGGNTITQHGHCWSTENVPTTENNKTTLGKLTQPKTFTSELTNLTANTTYYVRSYITYANGTVYGNEQTIKTLKSRKPKVTTIDVTNITITAAQCGGVNDNGGYTVTQRGVCWNKTGNPTLENNIGHTNEGNGTGSFTSQITGLTENTTYYVTAYATNEKGTSYGTEKEFTTVPITLPTVTTTEISNITVTSATSGGNITSDGNGTISARGVCWNTAGNPTLENSTGHTDDGTGTGSFTSQITGLTENTTYYVTAYATNEKGTSYGQTESFKTKYGFVDPRDGQEYIIVDIGNQTWMAENLKYLPSVSPSANGSDDDPYYYVYGYQGTNVTEAKATDNYQTYGVLYNWTAALNACPPGWHLPSDDEWKILEMALGMSQSEADNTGWRGTDEGGKMKETGTTHWNSPNTGATNTSGFTALPGGYRSHDGSFDSHGHRGRWWSSSEYSGTIAWYRTLYYGDDQVGRFDYGKALGFSVRCLKN